MGNASAFLGTTISNGGFKRSKKVLIKDLRESLPDIYDIEMREIYESTLEKLETISDEDFSEIGIYIADEFIEGEEYEVAE